MESKSNKTLEYLSSLKPVEIAGEKSQYEKEIEILLTPVVIRANYEAKKLDVKDSRNEDFLTKYNKVVDNARISKGGWLKDQYIIDQTRELSERMEEENNKKIAVEEIVKLDEAVTEAESIVKALKVEESPESLLETVRAALESIAQRFKIRFDVLLSKLNITLEALTPKSSSAVSI